MTVKPFLRLWARTSSLPWPARIIDHAGRVLPRATGVAESQVRLSQCRAVLYTPPQLEADRCVLYLHGGAFYVGGRYLHRQMIGRIAKRMCAPMLAVNYRKLPAHTMADAVDDCVEGYRYLLSCGVPADRITIMGDSAGAYLSLVLGSTLRSRGLPVPGAIVAMSPLVDLDHSDKLAARANCAVFPRAAAIEFARMMDRRRGNAELVSPATSDVLDFPPTLLHASRHEYLYPDAVLMAQRLRAAGRVCELHTWDTAVHIFHAASHTPESTAAIRDIVAFVDTFVPRAQSRRAL